MSTKANNIIIVDSTANRREELCKLWSEILGYEVVYYGGGDFFRFQRNAVRSAPIPKNELDTITLSICLFHVNDLEKYKDSGLKKVVGGLKKLVDRCETVVLFSGAGLVNPKSDWPTKWLWIPRAILGWRSATEGEWRQLANWLSARPPGSEVHKKPILLSVKTEPHFLRALLILCQGFLAADRMPTRVPPSAVARSRKREWWSVPLLKSAGCNLEGVVEQEWGENMPPSLEMLLAWIAGKESIDDAELSLVVEAAKKELECKITK